MKKGSKLAAHHGMSRTRIYNIWKRMRQRCNLETHPAYWRYGGAGIKVCPEWDNPTDGFLNFYEWSMANGYSDEKFESGRGKYSVDRIDNTKGYSPDNCRWATAVEQANNRKTNRLIEINGETKSIAQWLRDIPMYPGSVYQKIKAGMTPEEAISWAIDYREKHPLKNNKTTINW